MDSEHASESVYKIKTTVIISKDKYFSNFYVVQRSSSRCLSFNFVHFFQGIFPQSSKEVDNLIIFI